MGDLVPVEREIGREALERIIQRAAELQAKEREVGDHLTETQVMELGKEVGLPTRYLQQAILEDRTRAASDPDTGIMARWIGPSHVGAQRTVPGEQGQVEKALDYWMTEQELLTVKRRYKEKTSWEPRRDWLAAIKRSLGLGGRRYALSRAREVVGAVTALERGWSYVTLTADLTNTRGEYVGGGLLVAGSGGSMTGVAIVLGVAVPVAIVPAIAGVVAAAVVARARRRIVDHVLVALEQVLDRLEHGEIDPGESKSSAKGNLGRTLRDEVRKHLGV